MTQSAKPAVVRFYVDADVLGLAKILVQVRSDVTYPGDPGGVLHQPGPFIYSVTRTRLRPLDLT